MSFKFFRICQILDYFFRFKFSQPGQGSKVDDSVLWICVIQPSQELTICDSLAHLKTSFLNFIPDLCILTWIPPIQKVMAIIFFWHYVILAFLGRSQLEGHHCNRFSFWQIIIVESCVVNNIFLSTFTKEQKSVPHYSLFLLNKWIIYINIALLFTLRCSLL
jgi:hypothetical protein